jgi:hypothetical protein
MLLQFSRYGLPPSGELESRRQFWIERVRRDAAHIGQPLPGFLSLGWPGFSALERPSAAHASAFLFNAPPMPRDAVASSAAKRNRVAVHLCYDDRFEPDSGY